MFAMILLFQSPKLEQHSFFNAFTCFLWFLTRTYTHSQLPMSAARGEGVSGKHVRKHKKQVTHFKNKVFELWGLEKQEQHRKQKAV